MVLMPAADLLSVSPSSHVAISDGICGGGATGLLCMLSAEDITKQAYAATKLERTLSAVGCGGTAYDSGSSVMKSFK